MNTAATIVLKITCNPTCIEIYCHLDKWIMITMKIVQWLSRQLYYDCHDNGNRIIMSIELWLPCQLYYDHHVSCIMITMSVVLWSPHMCSYKNINLWLISLINVIILLRHVVRCIPFNRKIWITVRTHFNCRTHTFSLTYAHI